MKTRKEAEIKELAKKVQEGDEKAFKELFDTYFERIFRFSLGILKNSQDAEDVTSITFTYVWDNRGSLRNPDQMLSWMYQIAKHRSFDVLRVRKRTKETSLENFEEIIPSKKRSLESKADQFFISREVRSLIEEELSAEERVIIYLRFEEDLEYKAIAERLGATPVAIRVKMHRTIKKLKKTLEKDDKKEIREVLQVNTDEEILRTN